MSFKSGESGNPGGKVRRHNATILRDKLIENGLEEIALKNLKELLKSTNQKIRQECTKMVLEFIYGKPAQTLEHKGEGDEPIKFQFIVPKQGLFSSITPTVLPTKEEIN
jgi:hypothetical protein